MLPPEDITDLKTWRKEHKLSQRDLAMILGVHINTVANWDKGRTHPGPAVLLALESISQQRKLVILRLRRAQLRIAHKRKLKMIEQDMAARRKAFKDGYAAGKAGIVVKG